MAARPHAWRSRKVVHVAMGSFALALRWLTWWQAAVLAAVALLFNLFVLPRLAAHLYRPGELTGSARSGIVLYPMSVLVLALLFPLDRTSLAEHGPFSPWVTAWRRLPARRSARAESLEP